MSITQKIEKYYKNNLENIKKMKNGHDRDMSIGALVEDVGGRCIKPIAKLLRVSFRKVKRCYALFTSKCEQIKLEFRGRKRLTTIYPNLENDVKEVIKKYESTDSQFKTEKLFISINPTSIINELIINYNYPEKFACYNSIHDLLIKMGYRFKRIPKSKVLGKIEQTDAIFENVHEELEDLKDSDNTTAGISIDDKANKKIGNISDNGKTWEDIKALDHDTTFDCTLKICGIKDLKTNETFISCTKYSSTAEFKVDCIEEYIKYKNQTCQLKCLKIFLDNGPENSGRRLLWLHKLYLLAVKYNIVIRLVYYPPYHSKYNPIERVWARVQTSWNKVIIDTVDKAIDCLNKMTWCGVPIKANLIEQKYEKGVKVNMSEIDKMNEHIIREEGLEKWSIVITPFSMA
jgi:hypothetical protein